MASRLEWESGEQLDDRVRFLEWYLKREGFKSMAEAFQQEHDRHRIASMGQCYSNVKFFQSVYDNEIMQVLEAYYQANPAARPVKHVAPARYRISRPPPPSRSDYSSARSSNSRPAHSTSHVSTDASQYAQRRDCRPGRPQFESRLPPPPSQTYHYQPPKFYQDDGAADNNVNRQFPRRSNPPPVNRHW